MLIQILLTVWLLFLIFFTNKFRQEGHITQQRLFSVFIIIWAVLGIAYYDVLLLTIEPVENTSWQTYLPTAFFSICAGLGTYYLMMTFGKLRIADEKNRRYAQEKSAKNKHAKTEAVKNKKKN